MTQRRVNRKLGKKYLKVEKLSRNKIPKCNVIRRKGEKYIQQENGVTQMKIRKKYKSEKLNEITKTKQKIKKQLKKKKNVEK